MLAVDVRNQEICSYVGEQVCNKVASVTEDTEETLGSPSLQGGFCRQWIRVINTRLPLGVQVKQNNS